MAESRSQRKVKWQYVILSEGKDLSLEFYPIQVVYRWIQQILRSAQDDQHLIQYNHG